MLLVYLDGTASIIKSSPNLEMIAMTTSGSEDNEVFIYEQYTEDDGKRSQKSWSKWSVRTGEKIIAMEFRRNALTLVTYLSNKIFVKKIDMYTRVTASPIRCIS